MYIQLTKFAPRVTVTWCRVSDRRCGGGTSSCPHYHDHCHCDHCTGYQVRETCRHCIAGEFVAYFVYQYTSDFVVNTIFTCVVPCSCKS